MNGQTGKAANGQSRTGSGSDFRSQLIWRESQDFAEKVAATIVALPRDRAADVIATQLMRSASSIAANVAEGYGRFSQPAYKNHLSIARGSAFESESWIDLLLRRNYISVDAGSELIASCVEVQNLITARMKTLGDGKSYTIRDEVGEYDADG